MLDMIKCEDAVKKKKKKTRFHHLFPISCPVFWQLQVPQIAALIQQVIRIYRLFWGFFS